MARKKTTPTAAKAAPTTTTTTTTTPTTFYSISEMNELLFKAAKLIEIYDSFISNADDLSPAKSNALFQMFNEASYQDVMLFKFLLLHIESTLNESNFDTSEEFSDGCYYLDLIHDRLKE